MCACTSPRPEETSCHCSAEGCHRTFTSVTAFDLHQAWDGGRVTCRDPATMTRRSGRPVLEPGARGYWRRADHPRFGAAEPEAA